jgi:hypothetical protein
MPKGEKTILTDEQLADYEELGFLHSIPILSEDEVRKYRAEVEKTCRAIGGRATRLDGAHLFFRWAWDLSTHPRLLNCLEQVLGPNILLKSTRFIYKYGGSASYVGWHQDGVTENLSGSRAPAIWLGLTEATVENGCLRVVPRSHRRGLFQHDSRPDLGNLADTDTTVQVQNWFRTHGEDLSGKLARVPPDLDLPFDIVMRPGEMSFHHPLVLHGSNLNLSPGPRIGLSASYSAPELYDSRKTVARVRGDGPTAHHLFEVIDKPPTATFEEAVAAYRISGHQILFASV